MAMFTLRLFILFVLIACGWTETNLLAQTRISISRESQGKAFVIDQHAGKDLLYRVEVSSDMSSWHPWAQSWGPFRFYMDLSDSADSFRFYRLLEQGGSTPPDWVNQLGINPAPLLTRPRYEGDIAWVKFVMPLDASGDVLFQNSQTFPFHFDFATRELPAFAGMSSTDFEHISLYPETQQVALGALLFPSNPSIREVGVQFVGKEAFEVESVLDWLNLLSKRIRLEGEWQFFYMPTFEQKDTALASAHLFTQSGFPMDSPSRWVDQDALYSSGWALGRLQFVPASQLDSAFADGTLLATDILILDTVPAEVPPVAGIISLTPATPNAHVAILSKSLGIPFAFIADPKKQSQLMDWVGEDTLFIAGESEEGVDVKTLRVGGQLTDDQKAKLLALKQLPKLEYTPISRANQLAYRVSELTPEHLQFVGGKAANMGFLLRTIPDHAPQEAIAFSFDLWAGFMAQIMPNGKPLKETIAEHLGSIKFPVENPSLLSARLQEMRDLIMINANFSALQQRQILQALVSLDPTRRIRFRSSTNVEDSEQFSGAGLYDSYSGCLGDELDQDNDGPSECDPTRMNERGVFRAIQKVYASFYNENAFLERLRRGVDEAEVGMAILAHYSFPNEIEWANGVGTLRVQIDEDGLLNLVQGSFVTQKEAVSVTNPDQVAAPEVVRLAVTPGGDFSYELEQASGLVQLGATVLDWTDDYALLTALLMQASGAYLEFFPDKTEALIDFEYKYVAPGRFVVKQIREVPKSPLAGQVPPISFSSVDAFEVVQGEFGDMMARHRLKSVWRFQSWGIIGEDLPQNPGDLLDVDLEFIHNHKVLRFQGALNSLPGAEVNIRGKSLIVDWHWGEDGERVDYRLEFDFLYDLRQRPSPFLDLSDAEVELTAHYATPRPMLDLFRNRVSMVDKESVDLADIDPADPNLDFPHVTWRRRVTSKEGDLNISSDFFVGTYKFRGETPWILKTMVLQGWGNTRVTPQGLDTFSLASTFSQTYWPGHHNFIETLILEPRLEPELNTSLAAELESRNVRAWIVTQDSANVSPTLTSKIQVLTLDNRLMDP